MPHLADWCDEATYVHWTQEGGEIPNLLAAYIRLKAGGTASKVLHPSPAHDAKDFPAPEDPD
jgi:hypothetical protein